MNLQNARPLSGVAQAFGYMNHMYPNNMSYGHYGNTIRGGSGFGSYLHNASKKGLGWYSVGNNNKTRGRGYGKENMDGLTELNKAPRGKGYKNRDAFGPVTLAVKDQNLPSTMQSFFVIKSYSEDDVHKSIKYNVWTSTPSGNKKLDGAFCEAKEKPDSFPIFLLFSVNTSGQFVGLAKMVDQVGFNKTVEYWQQDKWTGCFPVKWHIVKDVPNASMRHITLENNENKPVTKSAHLEIEKRKCLFGKNNDDDLIEALLQYYSRFGHLACFISDVEDLDHAEDNDDVDLGDVSLF
ncbi:hypothetical protein REPUB_Repub17cG0069300 [Reevesia pubescens]